MSDKETIEEVLLSEYFQKIKNNQNKFNLFSALNVSRKELVHSDLVAFFLSPQKPHGCRDVIIQEFFKCIYNHEKNRGYLDFKDFISLTYQDTKVYREYSNIDILLDLKSSGAVFAIENKIDHEERKNQIRDYQEVILNDFKHYKIKRIIFLTPDGIESKTYDKSSDVRCISISYKCLSKALQHSINYCYEETAKNFIRECIKHIEEDLMKTGEKQKLINNIWENYEYAKAIKSIYENRPIFSDLETEYRKEIIKVVNDLETSEVNFSLYPQKRGRLKEIKFKIKNWTEKGYDFTFIFYYGSYLPATRVFISNPDYQQNPEFYQKFANQEIEIFDPRFPNIKNWSHWRKVFVEEDYPKTSYIEDLSFNKSTVKTAVSSMKRNIKLISKYIKQALQ